MANGRIPNYNEGKDLPYHNQYNYNSRVRPEDRYETNEGPSMTIQGQALSVGEILERALGGVPPQQRNYEYFDVEDIDNINEMFTAGFDLTDLDELDRRAAIFAEAIERAKEKRDQDPDWDGPEEPTPEEPSPEEPVE